MRSLLGSTLALALMFAGATSWAQPSTTPATTPSTTPSTPPPPATPAGGGDATTHFQRALELYQEQDFAGALVEFRRAYELNPTYKLYYNIGQVCYQLTDYACALSNFENYLKEGGASVSSERRAEVERELSKLRLRVGHLEVVTNIPGVEISVDDVVVGKTPLPSSIVVSTGKRRISGTHEGYAPVSRIVEVAGTDSARVELVFAKAGEATAAAPVQYESRWNTISWIGLGVTAAFGVTSAVTGIVALNASDELKNQTFADGRGPSSEMESNRDRAETFALVSDIALGLSAATLVGTLIYTFVHKPRPIEQPPAEPQQSGKPKVDVSFTGAGAMLKGSF